MKLYETPLKTWPKPRFVTFHEGLDVGFFHGVGLQAKNWTSQIPKKDKILQKVGCPKPWYLPFLVNFAGPDKNCCWNFPPGEAAEKKEGTGGEDGRNARIRVRGV